MLVANRGHLQLTGLQDTGSLNQGGAAVRVLHAPADYVARYGGFTPAYNWQMVNLSPDFPTVGSVIAGLYPQSGGTPVDGVLALDPQGLAAMLTLTGPVAVTGWPVPIDAANVSAVTQNQSYVTYAGNDTARKAFLEEMVRTVFNRLSNLDLHNPVSLVDAMAPAVPNGHLMASAVRPAEESYLAMVGMSGAVPPVVSDSLELTTQNAAANKIDYYLHRTVTDRVQVTPVGSSAGSGSSGYSPTAARVSARVTVSLDNTAPASGLPPEVIGPGAPGSRPGRTGRSSPYTPRCSSHRPPSTVLPPGCRRRPSWDGGRTPPSSTSGPARPPRCRPPCQAPVRLLAGGWYELDLPSQPLINPDHVDVAVTVAPGWTVTGVSGTGVTKVGTQQGVTHLVTGSRHTVWVRVAPGG